MQKLIFQLVSLYFLKASFECIQSHMVYSNALDFEEEVVYQNLYDTQLNVICLHYGKMKRNIFFLFLRN